MKKIAIIQSNYIPWKGYFDIIAAVDEFIIYDDVQFTKNDWRNRNQIKTPNGLQWLSIPVGQNINRRIRDVQLSDTSWQEKHWKTLISNYSRAKHFDEVALWLEPIYSKKFHNNLSDLNRELIEAICRYIGVNTKISNSWDYEMGDGKLGRLINLCKQAKADVYISGPSAQIYLDDGVFGANNIAVEWFNYEGYLEYPQLWGGFSHGVSILDLLFNCGAASSNYMKFTK